MDDLTRDEYLTSTEMASWLKFPTAAAWRIWAQRHKADIPAKKLGRRCLWSRAATERYLDRQPDKAIPKPTKPKLPVYRGLR